MDDFRQRLEAASKENEKTSNPSYVYDQKRVDEAANKVYEYVTERAINKAKNKANIIARKKELRLAKPIGVIKRGFGNYFYKDEVYFGISPSNIEHSYYLNGVFIIDKTPYKEFSENRLEYVWYFNNKREFNAFMDSLTKKCKTSGIKLKSQKSYISFEIKLPW